MVIVIARGPSLVNTRTVYLWEAILKVAPIRKVFSSLSTTAQQQTIILRAQVSRVQNWWCSVRPEGERARSAA